MSDRTTLGIDDGETRTYFGLDGEELPAGEIPPGIVARIEMQAAPYLSIGVI